ncbi:gamma-glutamylcyclotransferase family protein [Vibrio sp. SCSIO 43137]|uniref:gamma-glutamylcyclotransferase family protein n=1 Tax=Vibrio sp. SCSIO 43137 TaxID=3021011 RepID=UPI002307CD29|nr:gamma-glutamylcyclotransferase family protein [Vibrio sp. SCSIO 43137]WCE31494.1 gamma-glutamylcyclotransferase [Vibrio sp. SCSIO 43137]
MYIFGYGSLMNSASRKLTGQTQHAIPAIASGLTRHWSKIDESYTVSPLVVQQGDGQVNGVLLKVDDAALAEFDQREAGYKRIRLSHAQIDAHSDLDTESDIWVYVVDDVIAPCPDAPIVQSYVDTVITGCLEVSEAFASHFIEHTSGWHHTLENDRHAPKYSRMAGVDKTHQQTIDQLMSQALPII